MNSLLSNVSNTHTYKGISEINFFIDDNEALSTTIDTNNLHIRSVNSSEEDLCSYASLFSDQAVMGKYATGQTKTKDEMLTRINDLWVKRWHLIDPYSALAVFKKDSDEFIGHVILGHGDEAGQSELAYLFMRNHWGKGYGTETVTAVVNEYAPATVKEGFILDGKSLTRITATARPDNPASVKILEKVGMKKVGEEEKFGALRHHFSINLKC